MQVPEIWVLQMIEPQGGEMEEMQVRKDVSGNKRMQVEQKTCLRGLQRERLGDGRVDGVPRAQPTRSCLPRQNCSHISLQ
jgi:hypothetical protein